MRETSARLFARVINTHTHTRPVGRSCGRWVDDDLPLLYSFFYLIAASDGAEFQIFADSMVPYRGDVLLPQGGGNSSLVTGVVYVNDQVRAPAWMFRSKILSSRLSRAVECVSPRDVRCYERGVVTFAARPDQPDISTYRCCVRERLSRERVSHDSRGLELAEHHEFDI